MENNEDTQAIEAAVKYATDKAYLGWSYDKVYDAFLAGVKFQKTRYKKPETDYYGG
jgi:hypothetical protein